MPLLPDDPIDERRLTLGQHLEELRWHVLRAVIYIGVALTVCMFFQEELLAVVAGPHIKVANQLRQEALSEVSSDVPSVTQTAVRDWFDGRERIKKGLREADRQAAIARTKLEKDPKAFAELLARDQAALEKDIEKLQDDLKAFAAKPDENRAKELAERRATLGKRAAELDERTATLIALADENAKVPNLQLTQRSPTEAFMTYLWISFIAALFIASPLVARELWNFVAKGLHSHEKRHIRLFAPLTYVAFILGALFGYYLLIPAALKFLASYGGPEIYTQFDLDDYVSLFLGLTLAVGLMFELPLVMAFLSLIGLFKPDTYARFRRYWILVAFIIAAIVTPTPDPLTQTICAAPLMILYEVGIWLSRFLVRKRAEPAPPPPSPPMITAAPMPPAPVPAPAPDAVPVPTTEVKS